MYKQYPVFIAFGVSLCIPSFSFGQVTFSRDIAPIVFEHCVQCHRPNGPGPFSLLDYQSARRHATQMALLTKTRAMPPWKADPASGNFVGLHPLSEDQISLIQRW